ncbi:hypothetical protein Y1Q_0017903 [Alligator mississippiensis]|uniref:Uncharacterized protein n=1 Tax=Alligator mississippiensis TaxID=8496 RepID=A0A151MXS5_ALLMI|nr:hypothetical protein Y1Q_0017903 [Alligator mississippiensis]
MQGRSGSTEDCRAAWVQALGGCSMVRTHTDEQLEPAGDQELSLALLHVEQHPAVACAYWRPMKLHGRAWMWKKEGTKG